MRSSPQPPYVRYELVNVHELPSVDLTKSIKSLIFTARGLQRFNYAMSKLNRPMFLLYCASFPADFVMLLADESTGKWLALVKVLCQLPLLLQSVVLLRVDILRCLLWTYEFWFLSSMSLVHCVMFVLYFGDARAAIVLHFWIGSQLSICVDANLQTHQLIGTSLVGILQLLWILISVALRLTPGTNTITLIRYHGHTVSSNDVMVNTLSIALIYMIRTVYRKRQHATCHHTELSIVQCVAYHCQVKFQVKQPAVSTGPLTETIKVTDVDPAAEAMTHQRLRLVRRQFDLLERDVVNPRIVEFFGGVDATSVPPWKTYALYAIGACSLALNMIPFAWKKYPSQTPVSLALYSCAMFCGSCYFGAFVASFSRKLLHEVIFSFDFCFLSLQFSAIHLCVCDLFYWDVRCFNAFYVWLSVHWVLTLDALTPAARSRLGLQIRWVIPIIFFVIIAISRVSLDLIFFAPNHPTHDRVLWSFQVLGHTIECRVVPFILNRVWTAILWCLRIIWRLWTSDENGRIVIQGNVEFVVSRAALRQANSTQLSRAVQLCKVLKRASARVRPSVQVADAVVPSSLHVTQICD